MELPSRVSVICMDTDATDGATMASQAASELQMQGGNGAVDEIAYRGGTRHCRRLKPSPFHAIGPVALQLEKRGQLADMELRPLDHKPTSTSSHLVKAGNNLVEVHVCGSFKSMGDEARDATASVFSFALNWRRKLWLQPTYIWVEVG